MFESFSRNLVISPDVEEMLKRQEEEADQALEDINVSIAAAQADHSRLAEEIRVLECHMIDYEKRLKSEREILAQISENLSTLSAERQSLAQESSRLASSEERLSKIQDLLLQESNRKDRTKKSVEELEAKFLELKTTFDAAVAL